jgi:hyperosmotically inducible protein
MRTLMILAVAAGLTAAADAPHNPESRLQREIRHELVMLPYYGVFDHLAYRLDGMKLTLVGQVTRPTLKSDAERVVKRIEGIEMVANEIEVLPLSAHDDRIRLATYRAIYGHPVLHQYSIRAVPPVHILVKHGNVTLEGVVLNQLDSTVAYQQSLSVPGVFSVTNRLVTERAK